MFRQLTRGIALLASLAVTSTAQAVYEGYSLDQNGDPGVAVYDTFSTPSNVSNVLPPPDVFLNASVSVGEISLLVANLSAKINVDAKVLSLLDFNAGVDASIDRVSLFIGNISARVQLQARLGNVVRMINDVLDSIDLNPVLAELGASLGDIVDDVGDVIGGGGDSGQASTLEARSFKLDRNILYSVNNYEGRTHTNRVLARSGAIVDQLLDNAGELADQREVGNFATDMRFTGEEEDVEFEGRPARQRDYVYEPFPGLSVVSAVYVDADGTVLGTQVISESAGGGSSSIAGKP